MEGKRELTVGIITLQWNQCIEDINQNHLQKILDQTKLQYGRLTNKLQREKCPKEISEIESSSHKVLYETAL